MDEQQTSEAWQPRTTTRVIEEHRYWPTADGLAALDRADRADARPGRPIPVTS